MFSLSTRTLSHFQTQYTQCCAKGTSVVVSLPSSTRCLTLASIHSFTRSLTHSFIHSFIHSQHCMQAIGLAGPSVQSLAGLVASLSSPQADVQHIAVLAVAGLAVRSRKDSEEAVTAGGQLRLQPSLPCASVSIMTESCSQLTAICSAQRQTRFPDPDAYMATKAMWCVH